MCSEGYTHIHKMSVDVKDTVYIPQHKVVHMYIHMCEHAGHLQVCSRCAPPIWIDDDNQFYCLPGFIAVLYIGSDLAHEQSIAKYT